MRVRVWCAAPCAALHVQGDRYTDAWLIEQRQNKGSGKPVSAKPFLTLVAPRCSVRCVACMHERVIALSTAAAHCSQS